MSFSTVISTLYAFYIRILSLFLLPRCVSWQRLPCLAFTTIAGRPGPDCLPASERADNYDDIGRGGGNVGRNPGPLLQVQLRDF